MDQHACFKLCLTVNLKKDLPLRKALGRTSGIRPTESCG